METFTFTVHSNEEAQIKAISSFIKSMNIKFEVFEEPSIGLSPEHYAITNYKRNIVKNESLPSPTNWLLSHQSL